MDQASDEHEHEKEILSEVVELEVEQEEDYQKKLLEYKKQLEEWKLSRRKKVHWPYASVEQRFTYSPLSFASKGASSQNSDISKQPLCILPTQRSKQLKKSKKKKRQAHGDTEEEEQEEDNQDASGPDGAGDGGPPKPEPPEKPDLQSIETWVREKASRIRRKPGEPILIPELSASGNITASDLCPRCDDSQSLFL